MLWNQDKRWSSDNGHTNPPVPLLYNADNFRKWHQPTPPTTRSFPHDISLHLVIVLHSNTVQLINWLSSQRSSYPEEDAEIRPDRLPPSFQESGRPRKAAPTARTTSPSLPPAHLHHVCFHQRPRRGLFGGGVRGTSAGGSGGCDQAQRLESRGHLEAGYGESEASFALPPEIGNGGWRSIWLTVMSVDQHW